MTYESLVNENMVLYRSLAKATNMLDEIKKVYENFNFFDTNYREMYEKLMKIYEILEVKKK